MPEKYTIFRLLSKQFNQDKKITEQILTNGWRCASRCRFPGIPESVLLDFFDAEPLHVRLTEAEELDEVGAIHIAYKLSLDGMLPTHLLGDDLKVF